MVIPPEVIPPATAFPVVQSWEQVEANMHRLEAYLESTTDAERDFAKDLLRRARCIVISSRGGRMLVGPSRFVGYMDNSLEKHSENVDKDGKETNPAISGLVGPLVEDQTVEEEFQRFCREHQVERVSQVRRTYWRVR